MSPGGRHAQDEWLVVTGEDLAERLAAYAEGDSEGVSFDTLAIAQDLVILLKTVGGVSRGEFLLGMAELWDSLEAKAFRNKERPN